MLASLAPAPRDGRGRDATAQEVEYAADWLREAGTKAWQLAGALADPALRGDPAPR